MGRILAVILAFVLLAKAAAEATHATAAATKVAKPKAIRAAIGIHAVIRRGNIEITTGQRNLVRLKALIGGQHRHATVQHRQRHIRMCAIVAAAQDAFAAGNGHITIRMECIVIGVNRQRAAGNHQCLASLEALAADGFLLIIAGGEEIKVPPAIAGAVLRHCASTTAEDGNHAATDRQGRFGRNAVTIAGDDDFAALHGHKALVLTLQFVAGDAVLAGGNNQRAAGDDDALFALDAVIDRRNGNAAALDFHIRGAVDAVVHIAQHLQCTIAPDGQIVPAMQRTAGGIV